MKCFPPGKDRCLSTPMDVLVGLMLQIATERKGVAPSILSLWCNYSANFAVPASLGGKSKRS